AAARLLAHPLRRGRERLLLPRVRPSASDEGLPVRLAPRTRRNLDRRRLLLVRYGNRRSHRHTDSGAVHGTGGRADAAAPAGASNGEAVANVALSRSGA